MTTKDETTDMARLSLSEQPHSEDAGDSDDDSSDSSDDDDNDRKRKNFDDDDDSDSDEDSCDSQDLEEIEDLMGKIQEEREKNQALAKAVVKMQQSKLHDTKRRKMFDHIMSLQGEGDNSEQK